jgi:transcriptional regulator with XRE-family HTH domain
MTTPVGAPVRNRLSRLLFERGWADGELSARTGIPRPRVNRIKNRRVSVTIHEALLISHALGLTVARVFFLADEAL